MSQGSCANPETRKLTKKQQLFCEGVKEHGNVVTAYKDAGYAWQRKGVACKWLEQRACNLARTPNVAAVLYDKADKLARHREVIDEFSLAWLRDKHLELMELCLRAEEYGPATRNLELLGKTGGLYSDTLRIDTDREREYSEVERAELRRIACVLRGQHQLPVLDVEAEENAQEEGVGPPKGAGLADE